MKNVSFLTLGCKVNQYDTEAMIELFSKAGYEIVDFGEHSDICVINTCTVTNLGDRKSRQMIHKAHKLNPDAIIAVTGCYSQRTPEEVMSIPGVNVVLGTTEQKNIVNIIENLQSSKENDVKNVLNTRKYQDGKVLSMHEHTRSFIKIQDGCNQFCSYCIIPYVRGPIRSRKLNSIIDEVKDLADSGFKEIVLTGIHIASYGKDTGENSLIDVIHGIQSINGIKRIRLGSLEPNLFDDSFISQLKDCDKLCEQFHISLQSGCDSILRRMNRKYTTDKYREIVDKLRNTFENPAVTTDIIVGFPGENDDEFERTYDFVNEIKFSKLHVFEYSRRKGTKAADFPDQVPSNIKAERSRKLISLGEALEKEYNKKFIGTFQRVLFEEQMHNRKGWYQGFTSRYVKVLAEGNDLQGKIVDAYIDTAEDLNLIGKISEQ